MPWPPGCSSKKYLHNQASSLSPPSRELWALQPQWLTIAQVITFFLLLPICTLYILFQICIFDPVNNWAYTIGFMVLSYNRISLSNTGTMIHTSSYPNTVEVFIFNVYHMKTEVIKSLLMNQIFLLHLFTQLM